MAVDVWAEILLAQDRARFLAAEASRDDGDGSEVTTLLQQAVTRLEPHDVLQKEGYRQWPTDLELILTKLNHHAEGPRSGQDRLLLGMIQGLSPRLRRVALPLSLVEQYALCANRILKRVESGQPWTDGTSNDVWRKDLALLAVRLLPCVSHVVAVGGLPRRTLIRPDNLISGASLRALMSLGGRRDPLLENHVHPGMLEHFDERGREACFALIAELLAWRPSLRGLLGTSWYYDPSLGSVSPRLRYLHDVPARHGAVFLRAGHDEIATANASAKSPGRAALIQQGRYRPRNYTLVWASALICHGNWMSGKVRRMCHQVVDRPDSARLGS
jgi:hypothetical protein